MSFNVRVILLLVCFLAGREAVAAEPSELHVKARNLVSQIPAADASGRTRIAKELEQLAPMAYLFAIDECQELPDWEDKTARQALEKVLLPLKEKWAKEREKREQARVAWMRKTTLDAYEAVGDRNPQWDDDVRQAFTIYAQMSSYLEDNKLEVYSRLNKAINAGCKDPFVLYLSTRFASDVADLDPMVVCRLHEKAAVAMAPSRYPMIRLSFALANCAGILLDTYGRKIEPQTRDVCRSWVEASCHMLCDGIRKDHAPDDAVWNIARPIMNNYVQCGGNRRKAHDIIQGALKQDSPLSLALRGLYLWSSERYDGEDGSADKRGDMVNPKEQGRDCLERAWEKDPTFSGVADFMIRVAGDDSTRDRWLRRGLESAPDPYDTAKAMLDYMDGHYGYSNEKMLAFARAMVAERGRSARLPFIMISTHERVAKKASAPGKDYFSSPSVWKDIQEVYESHLKIYPKHDFARSSYAKWACRCGQWKDAAQQFKQLGDRVHLRAFNKSVETVTALREIADALAGPVGAPIQRAQELRQQNQHGEAIAVLDGQLKSSLSPVERRIAYSERCKALACRDFEKGDWVDLMPQPDPATPAGCIPPPGSEVISGTWSRVGSAIEMKGGADLNVLLFAPQAADFEMTGELEAVKGMPEPNCAVVFAFDYGYQEEPFVLQSGQNAHMMFKHTLDHQWAHFLIAQVNPKANTWSICNTLHPQTKKSEVSNVPEGAIPFRLVCWNGTAELYGHSELKVRYRGKPGAGRIGLGNLSTERGATAIFKNLRLRKLTAPPTPEKAAAPKE